jgi:predicted permease
VIVPALLSDVRLACRSMRRQPAFTAVVIGTLALGIGANTAMFALVHAALLKPLPYAVPDRLVLARRTVGGAPRLLNSAPDYYDYQAQIPGLAELAASRSGAWQTAISGGGEPEHVSCLEVSHDLFSTLGVKPSAGRWFGPDEDRAGAPAVVMISERVAIHRFGGAARAVGQPLTLGGMGETGAVATVVGVMPRSFRFLQHADMWTLRHRGDNDGPTTRQFHNWVLVGRLRSGLSIDAVQRQADVVSARLQRQYPMTNKNKALRLEPLQDALLGSDKRMLLVLTGAVGVVLLIACANVAGLLVTRGVARRSELAVRAALGASRGRIAAQLLTEGVVLAALGGLGGVALSFWLQRLLPIATGLAASGIAPGDVEVPILLFALMVSLLTGVLSGIAPAARAASGHLAASLAPGARATDSKGSARMRGILAVAQVALSMVLLVGAGLLLESLRVLMAADLGFDSHNLLVASIDQPSRDPSKRIQFQKRLSQDLAAIPGVTALTLTSHVPIRDPGGNPPMWPARRAPLDASQEMSPLARVVAPGYFKAVGIPLVAGRDLTAADRQGTPPVMVIDQAMADEFFPGENPIGEHVMAKGMVPGDTAPRDFEVVGVVRSARINAVTGVDSTAYVSSHQFPMNGQVNVLLRSPVAAEAVGRTIRRLIAPTLPNTPVDPLASIDDIVDEALLPRRVMTVTLSTFAAIAVLLAAIGLYGVMAFHVTQRTHEIGVRMTLGATPAAVVAMVLRRAGLLVLLGLALGTGASWYCSVAVNSFLFQVKPNDPHVVAGALLVLALAGLVASAVPARRAAKADPVVALRRD